MGRKKRGNNAQNQVSADNGGAAKKAKSDTAESFLVKKYRADKITVAMEAFVKYTKSHRMLDAQYVRWTRGVTPEKPHVFSTRVGGTDLGWGRGSTRDAAIDCSVRAAFSLVGAHGYRNFPLDDDCMMEAPEDNLPAPPPPPPPPPGLPPSFAGLPPPPTGLPPPPQPLEIPQPQFLVHQPAPMPTTVTPATAVSTTSEMQPAVSLNLSSSSINTKPSGGEPPAKKKQLKGGLTLVYSPEKEGKEEECMEERRASLGRYQKLLLGA